MKITSVDGLSKWLEETDPEKMHVGASECLKQLENLADKESPELAEATNLIFNVATFMEIRAVYLLLQRHHKKVV